MEEARQQTTARVAGAATIMVAAILASRVLGLLRDIVIARYFGASAGIWADCYRAAFTLPDFFYYLVAGGALSSAFIPVFSEYRTRASEARKRGDDGEAQRQEDEGWRVFSIFGTAIAIGLSAIVVVGEIFTPWLLKTLVVPGPEFTPEKIALTTQLTRIIFPAQLFFFLGGLMMSTLYVRGRFLFPALGPVVYNLAIITGGVLGGGLFGPSIGIFGLCWGVLIGAFLGNIVIQVWALRRIGAHYRPSLDVRHPGVVRVARLMLPVLLGLSLTQLHVMLTRPFGSYLPQGSITWLDNANKVMQIPLGIFAQALSIAIFPTLSAIAARRRLAAEEPRGEVEGAAASAAVTQELRAYFSLGLRSILLLTIPSSALIIVLAVPLIRVLFQRGLWGWEDTVATASATAFYSLAIFAYSGAQIVNRGFYALQNTVTPMVVGTVVTALYIALNFVLIGPMRQNGLALSMSLAAVVNLLALLWLLRRALGGLPLVEIASSVSRVAAAAVAAGLAAWGLKSLLELLPQVIPAGRLTFAGALLELLTCSALGAAVYIGLVRLFRVPEAAFVAETLRQRLSRGRIRGVEGVEG